MDKKTALVGLSGGVDSAAAALLLKEQGWHVIGATMLIWDPSLPVPAGPRNLNACLSPQKEDVSEIRTLAEKIGIDYLTIDCREAYRKAVLDNFRSEYAAGRTPNPCVICNSVIKFGVLPQAAREQGIDFDKFATGHYARIEQNADGEYLLKTAKDLSRDQSYFLHRLTQSQLAQILFPLGEMTKDEIRRLARKAGLAVADKQDSQDFYCGDYNDLLNFPNKEGDLVLQDGTVIGRHTGIWGYTIGKRKGLGLSGFKEPMYVVGIDAANNRVIIGPKASLYSDTLCATDLTWTRGHAPAEEFDACVKIRNLHHAAQARIRLSPDRRTLQVRFRQPQLSITAGQSAVLYDSDTVLGGGVIL